jgi:hypothetical protein
MPRDLNYAVRIFAKSPVFTLMALLPYGDPGRLAYIWTPNDHFKVPVPRELSPTDGDFSELAAARPLFLRNGAV